MSKEAMKLALEALKQIDEAMPFPVAKLAQAALREALAEHPAQQEPAGWRPATFHRDNLTFNPGLPDEQTVKFWKLQGVEIEYCYTSPPAQRKPWAGLTDEDIQEVRENCGITHHAIKTIEAKLKEKNNGN